MSEPEPVLATEPCGTCWGQTRILRPGLGWFLCGGCLGTGIRTVIVEHRGRGWPQWRENRRRAYRHARDCRADDQGAAA